MRTADRRTDEMPPQSHEANLVGSYRLAVHG